MTKPTDGDFHAFYAAAHHDVWWAKTQQWTTANWTVALLAGIVGVSKLLEAPPQTVSVPGLLAILQLIVALGAMGYIARLHYDGIIARQKTAKLRQLRAELQVLAQQMPDYVSSAPDDVRGAIFPLLLVAGIAVTHAITTFALLRSANWALGVGIADLIIGFAAIGSARWASQKGPLANHMRTMASRPGDSKHLDARGMNQGAMTTVIGLIAGLAIAAWVVVARDLHTKADLLSPRVVLGSAIAALFATSAFGRGKTHFAKGTDYDFALLLFDIPMVLFGGAAVGLLSRDGYSFDRWIWGWLFVFLTFLNVRNFYLLGKLHVQGLLVGIIAIIVGWIMVGIIWLRWSTSPTAAFWAGIAGLALVIIQFVVEIAVPFARGAGKTPPDGAV